METDVKIAIRTACRSLLRPIVLLLLRCGLTWKEFADLSKEVFVEAATAEFGIRGRPTNISRVSILTGISRKEVKRQRELLDAPPEVASAKTTDATRVLSGWFQDADFSDAQGQPLPLAAQGPSPSFSALFARYGGDTSEQGLIKELRTAKAVGLDHSGNLVAKSRYYMPSQVSGEWIDMAGQFLHDLGVNINFNLEADKSSDSRFLGYAADHKVDPAAAAQFRAFMEERGQQFLQSADHWLAQHSINSQADANTKPIRLGVGIFTIQDNKS